MKCAVQTAAANPPRHTGRRSARRAIGRHLQLHAARATLAPQRDQGELAARVPRETAS